MKPTIVFDWGDTLMKNFSAYQGPMVDWPVVEAVPGAAEMLQALQGRYRLVLASNAEASSAEKIRQALARVELDSPIEAIFTFHELGARKPSPAFFGALQEKLGSQRKDLTMVGDSYRLDILPAHAAGWRTIWFNPEHAIADAHLPLQTFETDSLAKIPALLEQKALPDYETCLTWYLQEAATHTLLAHVQTVAAAAYQMAIWLQRKGVTCDALLTHRGGILHDLAKLTEEEGGNHAVGAYDLLMAKDEKALALIARRHLMGDLKSDEFRPQTWEEKLVHYADKLVEGSQLIPLTERMKALQRRYPLFRDKISKNLPLVQGLENEVADALGKTPEALLSDLKAALFNGTVK